MISSLASLPLARWTSIKVSRQKKDALFEIAARIESVAERARSESGRALSLASKAERRKPLRRGLELLAGGADAEGLERGLSEMRLAAESDPGAILELRLTLAGLGGILAGEHPYVLMRRMTAHLGAEYFEKTSKYLLSRLKRRRPHTDTLVVPGDMPDLIRSLALDPRNLERAVHAAGRDISAAILAGCPQESLNLVKPLYGKIGGASLEDDASQLRGRLSGDEISQAQAAFGDLVRSLEERGEIVLGSEDDLATDPAFIAEFTRIVLALDERTIKEAFRQTSGGVIAVAMQGMQPVAHERILGVLSKRDERRILDAIDDSNPLQRTAIRAAGSELAVQLLAAASRSGTSSKETIARLERLRDWED